MHNVNQRDAAGRLGDISVWEMLIWPESLRIGDCVTLL